MCLNIGYIDAHEYLRMYTSFTPCSESERLEDSVLQCVAVCCSALQRVDAPYSELERLEDGVLQHAAVCCSVAVCCMLQCVAVRCSVLQRVVTPCFESEQLGDSVLQCVDVLECVAVHCSVLSHHIPSRSGWKTVCCSVLGC